MIWPYQDFWSWKWSKEAYPNTNASLTWLCQLCFPKNMLGSDACAIPCGPLQQFGTFFFCYMIWMVLQPTSLLDFNLHVLMDEWLPAFLTMWTKIAGLNFVISASWRVAWPRPAYWMGYVKEKLNTIFLYYWFHLLKNWIGIRQ